MIACVRIRLSEPWDYGHGGAKRLSVVGAAVCAPAVIPGLSPNICAGSSLGAVRVCPISLASEGSAEISRQCHALPSCLTPTPLPYSQVFSPPS